MSIPISQFILPSGASGKEYACLSYKSCRRLKIQSLGGEDPLGEETATHSSILAWEIPRTEEPGGLQPMGSQRVDMAEQLNNNKEHIFASFFFPLVSMS